MNLQEIQGLVQLANAADLLDNSNVQNLLFSLGIDDDKELMNDAKEYLSYKALGKLTSPDPFYPLPTEYDVNGEIELGKVGRTESPFGLSIEEMTQHLLIAGRSGSGKTTLLYNMMNQLLDKGINFWCFDYKKEFRGFTRKSDDVIVLRPENFKFNPLRPPEGIPPLKWLSIFCDVFSHSTSLLEGSNSFLLDQVYNLYDLFEVFDGSDSYPSFHELMKILEHIYIPLSTRDARYLESVRNRILSCVLTAGDMLDCDKDIFNDLMEQDYSVIFEFYGISEHVATFLIEILLTKLYFYRMASGRKKSQNKPLIVLMDEARNIYDYRKEMNPASGIPIIDTMTERIRDFGVSFVICSQIPSEICTSAKSNTYSKIMMSLGNGKDISDLARCMGLDENQARFTYNLNVGNAIVKLAGRYPRPFWIRAPLISIEKDVSDFEINQKTNSIIEEFDDSSVELSPLYENFIDCLENRRKTKKTVERISDIVRDLLVNIFNNPYVPVTRRYEKLGLSRLKGKLAKDFVIENKYVREENIKVSNSISNFLVLTKKGLSFCEDQGLKGKIWTEIVMRKVSFRHRFYQFLIKNYLTQDGWTVNLESRVNGNNKVDIEADYMKKRRIAIEIAVSKFELHDIEKCIQDKNGFDEIRVVCKDETTKKRIENKIFGSNGGKKPDFVFVQTINGLLNSMPQKT